MPTIATCKLVPASCIDSTLSELDHISKSVGNGASISNLKLNHAMTREMVVKRPRSKPIALSPLILASSGSRRWLFWVSLSLIGLALGHTWTKYAANPRKSMFALRVLVAHGYVNVSLQLLELLSSHGYVMPPVWWGFATVGEHKRLNSILRKITRPGFLPADVPSFDKHCSRAYSTLFRSILLNPSHFQFIHIIKSYFSQI